MNASEIQHFLVVYDVKAGKPKVRELGNDYEAALRLYEELEEQHRGDASTEVVLLSADSLETIKRTHSSYFGNHAAFESLLPKGVLSEA
jgi:hypothetical protein